MNSDEICDKLNDVEQAVKANTSNRWWALFFIFCFFFSPITLLWRLITLPFHSKAAYSVYYNIPTTSITIDEKPHDCSFLTAPVGEKWCHHDRDVEVYRDANGTVTAISISLNKIDE